MGRPLRAAEGGLIYHALNRANARLAIFSDDGDFDAFERVLAEAVARYHMPLLAYCVMPNHFHLVLRPDADGDLSRFMRWLSLTHTQRWHAHRHSAGSGHLYQGRFKSFPVQSDDHFYTTNRVEAEQLGYRVAGIACYVYDHAVAESVPLYRWRSQRDGFYTIAADGERCSRLGYRPQGIACYLHRDPRPGTVPFYRFVDPRTGRHFYTVHPNAEFARS